MIIERARALRKVIEKASASLDNKDANTAVELFPMYDANKDYQTGDRFRVGTHLYEIVRHDNANIYILCK